MLIVCYPLVDDREKKGMRVTVVGIVGGTQRGKYE